MKPFKNIKHTLSLNMYLLYNLLLAARNYAQRH